MGFGVAAPEQEQERSGEGPGSWVLVGEPRGARPPALCSASTRLRVRSAGPSGAPLAAPAPGVRPGPGPKPPGGGAGGPRVGGGDGNPQVKGCGSSCPGACRPQRPRGWTGSAGPWERLPRRLRGPGGRTVMGGPRTRRAAGDRGRGGHGAPRSGPDAPAQPRAPAASPWGSVPHVPASGPRAPAVRPRCPTQERPGHCGPRARRAAWPEPRAVSVGSSGPPVRVRVPRPVLVVAPRSCRRSPRGAGLRRGRSRVGRGVRGRPGGAPAGHGRAGRGAGGSGDGPGSVPVGTRPAPAPRPRGRLAERALLNGNSAQADRSRRRRPSLKSRRCHEANSARNRLVRRTRRCGL